MFLQRFGDFTGLKGRCRCRRYCRRRCYCHCGYSSSFFVVVIAAMYDELFGFQYRAAMCGGLSAGFSTAAAVSWKKKAH
ncbi:hypothetical protein A2U01_0041706 [Trifolium medium]|uniref:Uncharacterized protein n=1 Tax=Trifolium medium TaxID=97028 RepID=A0A392Q8S7_9FABA|nr:hypothetical protein [Trifolium medium]